MDEGIQERQRQVLGIPLQSGSLQAVTETVARWAEEGQSRSVIAANVHVLMEAHDSEHFHGLVRKSDLVVPDGVPLVWALRLLGSKRATRLYGPQLMLTVCELAAEKHLPIGLYGGTSDSLHDLQQFLWRRFPSLHIACSISPPFRPLTPEEDDAFTLEIVDSGARILFVGIGCPKQERWMAAHRGRIPAVMLGVGAAFDFHAGHVPQAPAWMQNAGTEWLFRLAHEPRRLWKRYLKHNPRFVALFLGQLARERILARRKPSERDGSVS